MYTIGKISKSVGVTHKTLRHYEKIGLLVPSGRTESGYRLYSDQDVETINKIKYYKQLNFSLTEIAVLLKGSPEDIRRAMEKQIRIAQKSADRFNKIQSTLLDSFTKGDKGRSQTAILVLGMQRDFVSGPLGNERVKTVIEPIQRLLGKARESAHPVVYVCDCHIKGVHEELNIWGDHALQGSPGAEVIDELGPGPGDHIVHKFSFNGFYQTDLNLLLQQLHAGKLIVTGLFAHMCVAETVINAHHLGYEVIVPEECVNSLTKSEYHFALKLLKDSYAIEIAPLKQLLKTL
jgi:nicotinamidase-related amidase